MPRSKKSITVGSRVKNIADIEEKDGDTRVVIAKHSTGIVRQIIHGRISGKPGHIGNTAFDTVTVLWDGRGSPLPVSREKLAVL